jgi:hypothetical protein
MVKGLVSAAPFRGVHRGVGRNHQFEQQILGAMCRAIEMDAHGADAGGDAERQFGDGVAQALGAQTHILGVPHVGDHEFFTAGTADDRGRRGAVTERASYRDQSG